MNAILALLSSGATLATADGMGANLAGLAQAGHPLLGELRARVLRFALVRAAFPSGHVQHR